MTIQGRIQRNQPNTRSGSLAVIGKVKIGQRIQQLQCQNKHKTTAPATEHPTCAQCGAKAKVLKEYPQSLGHFRPTGKFVDHFHRAYGDQPSQLAILFYSDQERESCFERYELRDSKGKRYAMGDGVHFEVWNPQQRDYENMTKTEANADFFQNLPREIGSHTGWETILTLRFFLPETGVAGLWEFSTKGKASTIQNVRDMFDEVKANVGTVRQIKFLLSVEMHTGDSPQPRKYPVVSLVPDLSVEAQYELGAWLETHQRLPKKIIDKQTVGQVIGEDRQLTDGQEAIQESPKDTSDDQQERALDPGKEVTSPPAQGAPEDEETSAEGYLHSDGQRYPYPEPEETEQPPIEEYE